MDLDESKALTILRGIGALQEDGHFVLTSGAHAEKYVAKDALFPHLQETREIAEMMTYNLVGQRIEVVLAPAVAGQILGREIAHCIRNFTNQSVLSVYADKVDGRLVIKRGHDALLRGARTLIVEDVTTTLDSLRQTIAEAERVEANIVAVRVMWNRGGPVTDIYNFSALINLKLPTMSEAECKLHGPCSRGVPIRTDFGHGQAYLARQAEKQ